MARVSKRLARLVSIKRFATKCDAFEVAKLHFLWHTGGFVALRREVLQRSHIDSLTVSPGFPHQSVECEVSTVNCGVWGGKCGL